MKILEAQIKYLKESRQAEKLHFDLKEYLKLHSKPQKCSWKKFWKTTALSLKESRIFYWVLAFYSLTITSFIPYISPSFALSYSNAIIPLEFNKTKCGRYWEQETKIYPQTVTKNTEITQNKQKMQS